MERVEGILKENRQSVNSLCSTQEEPKGNRVKMPLRGCKGGTVDQRTFVALAEALG